MTQVIMTKCNTLKNKKTIDELVRRAGYSLDNNYDGVELKQGKYINLIPDDKGYFWDNIPEEEVSGNCDILNLDNIDFIEYLFTGKLNTPKTTRLHINNHEVIVKENYSIKFGCTLLNKDTVEKLITLYKGQANV